MKRAVPLCVIEVQHARDTDRDGSWHVIDSGRDAEWLVFRLEDVSRGYEGRPVRLRLADGATA
jgi:hypothetical protein